MCRWVIWDERVKALEKFVLANWTHFTIWNAGKQGRRLYRSLSHQNRAKVVQSTSIPIIQYLGYQRACVYCLSVCSVSIVLILHQLCMVILLYTSEMKAAVIHLSSTHTHTVMYNYLIACIYSILINMKHLPGFVCVCAVSVNFQLY